MKTYSGTKVLKAQPMTRGGYNTYRGWVTPVGEDPADEGYLVEYQDGGKPNHPDHIGYISWSPKDVFERTYHELAVDNTRLQDLRTVALDQASRLNAACHQDVLEAARAYMAFINPGTA